MIAIDHADNFKSIQLKLPPVKTKKFSKTAGIDETARAVGRAKAEQIEEIFTRKLTKNYAYLEILVSHPGNPSKNVIYGSNQIEKQLNFKMKRFMIKKM